MYRTYEDLQSMVVSSAGSLGSTLAQTLIPPLLHDDVWRGFEIVRTPFVDMDDDNPIHPTLAMVITPEQTVFVSSDPDSLPMLTALASAGRDFTLLADAIAAPKIKPVTVFEADDSERLFVAVPMLDSGVRLGTLVLVYSRSALNAMFVDNALGGALLGLLVLMVLLPINWYWGHRMATPLVRIAQRMDKIQDQLPEHLEPELYNYRDELGQLFTAYNRMVKALREKALLEQGILSAERLAAVGRLTASIAHEINSPLAGMLTALDTLKQRGNLDQRTLHTLGLVERGLLQVSDTVAALLVEARQQKRSLGQQDLEDVKTLIQPAAGKSRIQMDIDFDIPTSLPIAAGSLRQVLINLLNNAVQAAGNGGWVRCRVSVINHELQIEVANNGDPIPAEQLQNLFEPFVSYREGGLGLGLWVTYQLVSQMAGRIEVSCEEQSIRFTVCIPIDEEAETI